MISFEILQSHSGNKSRNPVLPGPLEPNQALVCSTKASHGQQIQGSVPFPAQGNIRDDQRQVTTGPARAPSPAEHWAARLGDTCWSMGRRQCQAVWPSHRSAVGRPMTGRLGDEGKRRLHCFRRPQTTETPVNEHAADWTEVVPNPWVPGFP